MPSALQQPRRPLLHVLRRRLHLQVAFGPRVGLRHALRPETHGPLTAPERALPRAQCYHGTAATAGRAAVNPDAHEPEKKKKKREDRFGRSYDDVGWHLLLLPSFSSLALTGRMAPSVFTISLNQFTHALVPGVYRFVFASTCSHLVSLCEK